MFMRQKGRPAGEALWVVMTVIANIAIVTLVTLAMARGLGHRGRCPNGVEATAIHGFDGALGHYNGRETACIPLQ